MCCGIVPLSITTHVSVPQVKTKTVSCRYDMQFWRHTSAGLQRVVRDDSETWIEQGARVCSPQCRANLSTRQVIDAYEVFVAEFIS